MFDVSKITHIFTHINGPILSNFDIISLVLSLNMFVCEIIGVLSLNIKKEAKMQQKCKRHARAWLGTTVPPQTLTVRRKARPCHSSHGRVRSRNSVRSGYCSRQMPELWNYRKARPCLSDTRPCRTWNLAGPVGETRSDLFVWKLRKARPCHCQNTTVPRQNQPINRCICFHFERRPRGIKILHLGAKDPLLEAVRVVS